MKLSTQARNHPPGILSPERSRKMKRIILNCKECGKPVEVEDMSDLFEDKQVVTCDDCYARIQAAGEAAADKVREEWKECGEEEARAIIEQRQGELFGKG